MKGQNCIYALVTCKHLQHCNFQESEFLIMFHMILFEINKILVLPRALISFFGIARILGTPKYSIKLLLPLIHVG